MLRKLATITTLLVAAPLLSAAPALADPINPNPSHVARTWHPTRTAHVARTWHPTRTAHVARTWHGGTR